MSYLHSAVCYLISLFVDLQSKIPYIPTDMKATLTYLYCMKIMKLKVNTSLQVLYIGMSWEDHIKLKDEQDKLRMKHHIFTMSTSRLQNGTESYYKDILWLNVL